MTGSVRTRAFLVDLQVDEPLRIRSPGATFANVRQLLAGVPNVTNHQWRNDMDTLNCLKSESGRSYLDESGIVQPTLITWNFIDSRKAMRVRFRVKCRVTSEG